MAPVFFRTAAELRGWLAAHHARATELIVGFYRKASGKGALTYHEALDEALCYGWIDGVRRKLDDERWTIRFTPRRSKSYWSAVNIRRANALVASGRMASPGAKAFEARERKAPAKYSFENKPARLDAPLEQRLRASGRAWAFFEKQPPWYQRTIRWYVMSAARDDTRAKRLERVLADSAAGRWVGILRDKQPKAKTGAATKKKRASPSSRRPQRTRTR